MELADGRWIFRPTTIALLRLKVYTQKIMGLELQI